MSGIAIIVPLEEVQQVATEVDLTQYLEGLEEVLDRKQEG